MKMIFLKKTISYQNPFKNSITIKIDPLETVSNATVTIYDLLGKKVAEIRLGQLGLGIANARAMAVIDIPVQLEQCIFDF